MDDEATHLSLGEVRRIIGRLRGPDLVRLSLLGRVWAAGLRYHDADDLLYEALDRILSGRRLWPSEVPLPAFLSQVMRSIASQWRQEDRREPLREDETEQIFDDEAHDPSATYEMDDLTSRMRSALASDPLALAIFEHILADSDRDEAQRALGIDATQYDTARRRMANRLFDDFHSGWAYAP
ncbi:RNA polymerase sigma factor [Bradyrhizobium sp. DASA03005]|uniref:RNA polymerase sigma factor n=1 Tax=Bradyrhizobium sp. SPXBL-02 TaxID=3395912 RepID=UPI003F6EC20F